MRLVGSPERQLIASVWVIREGFKEMVSLSLELEGRIGLTSVACTAHLAISYRLLKQNH